MLEQRIDVRVLDDVTRSLGSFRRERLACPTPPRTKRKTSNNRRLLFHTGGWMGIGMGPGWMGGVCCGGVGAGAPAGITICSWYNQLCA